MSVVLCATGALAQDAPSVKVGVRVQGWYQAVGAAAPDGSTANDFRMRRAYVYLTGSFPT